MTNKFIKYVCVGACLLTWSAHAIVAKEAEYCDEFNSYSFYFENFNEDVFYHCVYVDEGALNLVPDDRGSIPIFKALFSDLAPHYFKNFILALDDENLEKLFSIRDLYGDGLLEIATSVGYLDVVVSLLHYGLPVDQQASASTVRATIGNGILEANVLDTLVGDWSLDMAALLKIGGAGTTLDFEPKYDARTALFFPEKWTEIDFMRFKTSFFSETNLGSNFCETLVKPSVLMQSTVRQFKSCILTSKLKFYANYFDENGNSFLHLIVMHAQDPAILDYYLGSFTRDEREELLSRVSAEKFRPIHASAKYSQNPDMMVHLVAWGADINQVIPNSFGILDGKKRSWKTLPIHLIADRDDTDTYRHVLYALALGANGNAQNKNGDTVQHILLGKNITDPSTLALVNYAINSQRGLISFGSIELQNSKGATPLLYAVSKKRGDVNDKLSDQSLRHYLIIDDLLFFGADPDKADNNGWSPLIYYANFGYDADVFDNLLHYSSDACEAKTNDGVTVIAALNDNIELKNSNVTFDAVVKSPIGIFNQKCQGL